MYLVAAAVVCSLGVALGVEPGALTERQVEIVKTAVTDIWERHGVRIEWRPLDAVAREGCRTVTVAVHHASSQTSPARPDPSALAAVARRRPVAWIRLDTNGKPAPYVQVAVDVARHLATLARVRGRSLFDQPTAMQEYYLARAIGRSIAHEIGHYLLSSREHAGSGLMRAVIPFSELMTAPDVAFHLDARSFSCNRPADAVPIAPVVR